MKEFDVVVIGAGPGGYVAAIRCAQLGMQTACVESWLNEAGKPALGGTCLNVGCIPSKALLDSSHHYAQIQEGLAEHGISVGNAEINIKKMMARKTKVVRTLTTGVAGLFKKNGVEWLQGHGSLQGDGKVLVTPVGDAGTAETVQARHIIIATGSVPAAIPPAPLDQERIVDSTGALAFSKVPQRLGIIGAGVIGLELGSVWQRLGSEVVILEALDDFLPAVDRQIAAEGLKTLTKQGLDIHLGARVEAASVSGDEVTVSYTQGGDQHEARFDRLVVAVGRSPNTQGLGTAEVGLELDQRGFIVADEYCRTNLDNVYAVGDVVRGPMLAHKASEEGVMVAERLVGQATEVDFNTIPLVIYTWPEIAWVGQTEEQLKAAGISYRSGSFPYMGNGRARAMGEQTGMVKILAEEGSDTLLGIHILGANASELIAEATLAMEFVGCAEDIARTCHAHPTLAEIMHEAALAVDDRAIHI